MNSNGRGLLDSVLVAKETVNFLKKEKQKGVIVKVEGSTQVCVWRAMLEKLSTRLNLEKRGVVVINNLCPLCMKAEKTTQHILISCDIVQKV